jgi:hypothetical protein
MCVCVDFVFKGRMWRADLLKTTLKYVVPIC